MRIFIFSLILLTRAMAFEYSVLDLPSCESMGPDDKVCINDDTNEIIMDEGAL